MESYLNENFGGVKPKNSSEEALSFSVTENSEAEDMKISNQVAKESADVIILDDNFATIGTVAKWGRSVFINIKKIVQFQLIVNVVALIVNFSSACVTGSSPLTAVQLLWVNVIMVTLGALALATEPPSDGVIKRNPVGRGGSIISNVMWRNIFGQALYQLIVIWILQAKGKTLFELDGPDADVVLNTLIFNSFVFCQVFNEISSREMEGLNVFHGVLSNWVFMAVMSFTVVFQVILIEFLGSFASTIPLSQTQWFLSVLIGFLGMPVAMLVKLIPLSNVSNPACYDTVDDFDKFIHVGRRRWDIVGWRRRWDIVGYRSKPIYDTESFPG